MDTDTRINEIIDTLGYTRVNFNMSHNRQDRINYQHHMRSLAQELVTLLEPQRP